MGRKPLGKEDKKKMVSIRLKPCTIEVLEDFVNRRDLAGLPGDMNVKVEATKRGFIEMLMDQFIDRCIENEYVDSAYPPNITHEQRCDMFVRHRRAARGEKGYRFEKGQNPIAFVVDPARDLKEQESGALGKLSEQPFLIRRVIGPDEPDDTI